MNRLFVIFAAVILALAFVACGGGQDTESTTPVEESATTDETMTDTTTETTTETTTDTGMDTGMDTGTDTGAEEAPVE